jgi:metal-responsive CopG/Arc/MetJ family transcriptional regulator
MPRKLMNLKRVQIDMSEKALQRLEWIMEETDSMSLSEVIRDSLELREVLIKLRKEGKRVFAEDEKTGERAILLT